MKDVSEDKINEDNFNYVSIKEELSELEEEKKKNAELLEKLKSAEDKIKLFDSLFGKLAKATSFNRQCARFA